jgi:hypothetical protein
VLLPLPPFWATNAIVCMEDPSDIYGTGRRIRILSD